MRQYEENYTKNHKYSYTELGMLLGIFVGAGLATIMFAKTGEDVYFGLLGVGLALELGLAAAFDGSQRSSRERSNGPKKGGSNDRESS
jgi:hypothetical protein